MSAEGTGRAVARPLDAIGNRGGVAREGVRPGSAPAERSTRDALSRRELRATPGFYRRSWRRFRRDRVALTALAVLVGVLGFVLAAGLISEYVTGFSYRENHLQDKLTPPFTDGYILGSDGNGRDILTRLAYGGRVTLLVAVLATVGTIAIGGTAGLVAGYVGGWVDAVLMRLVDVLLSVPSLALLILIATLYSPGSVGLALVLAVTGWSGVARLLRGEVLSLVRRDYVDAARVVGAPPVRILVRHILPNVTPLLVVYASLAVPELILVETALSFLGLGVKPPDPSWGNMLGEAEGSYRLAWTNVFVPGCAIFVTALALYLVGTGLRDALDPRLGD